ncbi:hypothetical protein ACFLS7_04205 [Bacteroidota bacterium]
MKIREILILLFVVILVFSGCREISVTTQVHRDGSFTRTVTVTGDSSSVFEDGNLPYPIDSTWERVAVKDTSSDKKSGDSWILTYSKTFTGSKELMSEITRDTSWRKQLQCQITVDNSFGFFYSYLTFKQVYQPANPFTFLPYQDSLTSEDLLWLSGQKTVVSPSDSNRFDEVEERAEGFLIASVTAEMEHILGNGIVRLNDSALTPGDVIRFHDSIHRYVAEWQIDQPEKFIGYLKQWSGNAAFDKLLTLEPPLFTEFSKKVDLFNNLLMMDTYPETVEMPGLIIETNSAMLKGNQVSWEIQPMCFMFTEYKMVVESRVVNNWAFVVTGIVLLLLIVVMIVKAVKR